MGVGEGLDQSQFLRAHGLGSVVGMGEMGLVERGIFGGQPDAAAGKPGFEGIELVDKIIGSKSGQGGLRVPPGPPHPARPGRRDTGRG